MRSATRWRARCPSLSASPGLTFPTTRRRAPSSATPTCSASSISSARDRSVAARWNVTASYQRVNVDSVQGQDLDALSDTGPPIRTGSFTSSGQSGARLVTFPRYAVALRVDMVTLAATYGITDDLDVNLDAAHPGEPPVGGRDGAQLHVQSESGRLPGNKTALANASPGVGRRTRTTCSTRPASATSSCARKYQFLRSAWVDAAAGLVLRMPTGNEDDFQGTGDWELSPLLYLSTPPLPLGGPCDPGLLQRRHRPEHHRRRSEPGPLRRRHRPGDRATGRRSRRLPRPRAVPFVRQRRLLRRATPPPVKHLATATAVTMAPLFGLDTARASYY